VTYPDLTHWKVVLDDIAYIVSKTSKIANSIILLCRNLPEQESNEQMLNWV
jgi:hypothetical protein